MQRIRMLVLATVLAGAGLASYGARARLFADEVLWEAQDEPFGEYYCGPGPGGKCKEVKTEKCTQWQMTSVGGTAGMTGGGVNFGGTCGTWVTTVLTYYWTEGKQPGE
jgi:hypothetical protein